MSTAPRINYTVAEYLAREAVATEKHEYYQGDIFAMAGGSPAHNRIAANILGLIGAQLQFGPCLVNISLVLVNADGLYANPDVSIVCPPIEREPGPIETLVNPKVIVEVLSPTTERYDPVSNFRPIPSRLCRPELHLPCRII